MLVLFLISILFLVPQQLGQATTEGADRHFARAQELIQRNCGDCVGATKEGLDQGITELLAAIEQGYRDKVAAYRLLAEAYRNLVFVYDLEGSDEHKADYSKLMATYDQLLLVDPKNPEVHYQYGELTSDKHEQIAAYRATLDLDAQHFAARCALGSLLVREGDYEGGIRELRRGFEDAPASGAASCAEQLSSILRRHGQIREADAVLDRLAERVNSAKKRSTKPKRPK